MNKTEGMKGDRTIYNDILDDVFLNEIQENLEDQKLVENLQTRRQDLTRKSSLLNTAITKRNRFISKKVEQLFKLEQKRRGIEDGLDQDEVSYDPEKVEVLEKKHDFFGKFRGELEIELNNQLQEQKDILPKHADLMKQFLIQIGYENSSAAISSSRKLPNKFQR